MFLELQTDAAKLIQDRELFIKTILPDLKELAEYRVDYFGYREFKYNGDSFGFSTKDKWYFIPKTQAFCVAMREHFEQEITKVYFDKLKFVSRSKDAEKNDYLELLDQNEMGNSLVLYRFRPDKVESYFFNSASETAYYRDIMINNIPFLENKTNILSQKIESMMYFNEEYVKENTLPLKFQEADSFFTHLKKLELCSLPEVLIRGKSVRLTRKESELLLVLSESYSNKETANKLGISVRTVEGYVEKIRQKCCVNSKTELLAFFNKSKLATNLRY